MKIGIAKERRAHERRVAASPDMIKKLTAQGADIIVEAGAGHAASLADEEFTKAGARISQDPGEVFAADIVLKVQRPLAAGEGEIDEMDLLRSGSILVGALNPYMNREQVQAYADKGITAFSLELLPRSTRAQAMDILSSQANLAGYRAVVEGVAEYNKLMPMLMTAAGTVPAAKVFIMGAGVAGLQAIATARRLGAIVSATDVRAAAKEEIESLGAKFVGYVPEGGAGQGGYARPLTEEEQGKQREIVAQHLKNQDIVVTTALIPGRPAPRLVSRAMLESMKPGSVVVDIAIENGGNVEGAESGKIVEINGVRVVGHPNLPARLAPAASSLYARNLFNFLGLLIDKENKSLKIPESDNLIEGSMLTRDGKIVHEKFKPEGDAPAPPAPVTSEPAPTPPNNDGGASAASPNDA